MKAIAVFNGTADPEFCMPYLKNKAESISNEIIEHISKLKKGNESLLLMQIPNVMQQSISFHQSE